MENKFKDRDISFETLEKAVNGDYFAMQEVIRLFKPYMARLSIEEGRFNRELYERLVRKVMLITVRFKMDYDEKLTGVMKQGAFWIRVSSFCVPVIDMQY